MIANEFMEAEINKKDVPYNEKKLVDRYLWYSLNALVSVGFFFFFKNKNELLRRYLISFVV